MISTQATNFLNEPHRQKITFYREAAKEYRPASRVPARSEADDEEDPQTRLTLHANRAACSLALKNYGECVKDCKAALAIDENNAKAAYRLARALLGLKKHKQARDAAQWGLASAPDDKALTKTLAEAQRGLNVGLRGQGRRENASEAATHRAVFDARGAERARPASPATGASAPGPFGRKGHRVPSSSSPASRRRAPSARACAPAGLVADWSPSHDNGRPGIRRAYRRP